MRSEAVLVDAHYDHLGIARAAVNGDSIYNGADDDGSGTVAVMEIARVLAAQGGNRRTIIFAATTGEEVGLIGTNWYIAYPPFPLAQTVANFEIEMIGRPDSLAGGAGKGWLTGYGFSTMGPMLAAAGIPVVADPRPDQQFFQRSDNIAFARLGIVAHTWSTFNLHTDYHEVTDDVSKVDFDHMARVIDAGARAVWVLANGDTPAWNPGAQPAARPARLVQPPMRPPR
jgi:Zn-dependent M28 family amino/carboxypeptidase